MVSASRQGGALTRASAQLDLTFTFGGLKQGERVLLDPLLPNSLLCMRCLIAPLQWTRLDREVS